MGPRGGWRAGGNIVVLVGLVVLGVGACAVPVMRARRRFEADLRMARAQAPVDIPVPRTSTENGVPAERPRVQRSN